MAKSKADALQKLTEIFRKLGADDPESWARSQIEEGIPQFAYYVFMRQAWKCVVDENDDRWIDEISEYPEETTGAGSAIKRMLAKGVSREDMVDLVRWMQYEVLGQLCYQLADPGVVDFLDDTMPSVKWGLFLLDEDGNPMTPLNSLDELVIGMDPTGREMRSRKFKKDPRAE